MTGISKGVSIFMVKTPDGPCKNAKLRAEPNMRTFHSSKPVLKTEKFTSSVGSPSCYNRCKIIFQIHSGRLINNATLLIGPFKLKVDMEFFTRVVVLRQNFRHEFRKQFKKFDFVTILVHDLVCQPWKTTNRYFHPLSGFPQNKH